MAKQDHQSELLEYLDFELLLLLFILTNAFHCQVFDIVVLFNFRNSPVK